MITRMVADLIGAELDAAVAQTERRGLSFDVRDGDCFVDGALFSPSSDWSQGGPIIEREGIGLELERYGDGGLWLADLRPPVRPDGSQRPFTTGGTPPLAAMRAYVASRYGDTVVLP